MVRSTSNLSVWLSIAVAWCGVVGCGENEPPPFRLDMTQVVSNQLIPEHSQAIADILSAMFGTPDEPFALAETGLDQRKLELSAGPVWGDESGGQHGLYRRHCAHCHGISGDGMGPTAMILDPYPRDYRMGVFKFKSTYNPAQPTDEDLRHVLHDGVPGTAMPAFAPMLAPDEIDALVEYVKYLAMRGQMETALVRYVRDEISYDSLTGEGDPFDPATDEDQRADVLSILEDDVVAGWQEVNENVIVPEEETLPPDDRTPDQIAASAAKGRDLFYGTKANCVKCHGPTGMGDGQQDDFDNWNKAIVQFEDDTDGLEKRIQSIKDEMAKMEGEEREAAQEELMAASKELAQRTRVVEGLLPVRNAIPRNLRDGMFRGGRRPLDLYRRVHQGIAGTPMPAGGPLAPGSQGTLSDEEMWQIVDYVRSLPFEAVSRPQTRPVNFEAVVH
jgi:mono/diheme cytochrome c family protein